MYHGECRGQFFGGWLIWVVALRPRATPLGWLLRLVALRPRATPSGAARGDCVDRCQLPREGAWGRIASVARENNNPSAAENIPTTWILWYTAPSRPRLRRRRAARGSGDCVDRPQTPLRLKELPSIRTGIFLSHKFFRTSYREEACIVSSHCGRGQLPQSRACGASQHAADTAAAREPWVVSPG